MGTQQGKNLQQKKLEQRAGWVALKLLSRLARSLPEHLALRLGAGVGSLGYRMFPRYRRVAIQNLTQVFGQEWEMPRIRRTAREVFRHIGMNLMEFLRFPGMDAERLARMVHIEGEEFAREALEGGNGVLAITSHYGNFELFAAAMVQRGYPLSVIARNADDQATNDLINGLREGKGYHVLPRDNAARRSIAILRHNEVLGVLPDQNDISGIFVPFFGRLAATSVGPATMALRTGAAVLPAFIHRRADNTHVVKIYPALRYEKTGNREADVRHLTIAINNAIERAIREHPEQWFWLHNRWKTRPPEEAAEPTLEYGQLAAGG